jgi:hypothetical protein
MTARQAIEAARRVGVSVSVYGDKLALDHVGPIPADVLGGLKQRKAEILRLLAPIRPAFCSDDGWLAATERAERLGFPFCLDAAKLRGIQ